MFYLRLITWCNLAETKQLFQFLILSNSYGEGDTGKTICAAIKLSKTINNYINSVDDLVNGDSIGFIVIENANRRILKIYITMACNKTQNNFKAEKLQLFATKNERATSQKLGDFSKILGLSLRKSDQLQGCSCVHHYKLDLLMPIPCTFWLLMHGWKTVSS